MLNDEWQKSSYSGTEGSCVELRLAGAGAIAVRDSKDPDGPRLTFRRSALAELVDDIKDGKLHG